MLDEEVPLDYESLKDLGLGRSFDLHIFNHDVMQASSPRLPSQVD